MMTHTQQCTEISDRDRAKYTAQYTEKTAHTPMHRDTVIEAHTHSTARKKNGTHTHTDRDRVT